MGAGHHHHKEDSEKGLTIAFFLNLIFTIIEIIGGIYTNSLAILSDALHDLGDSFSLGLAWYFQRVSKKGRTEDYSYGYRRFSLLGAVINAIVLIVGSIAILINAIPALFDPSSPNAQGMLFLSILGILFNGIAVLRLRKANKLNEQMVMWHLLEDVLGWFAVLVGSVIMIFYDLPVIDPILSIGIASFIVYNVIRNLKKSLSIFLQATPEDLNEESIKSRILSVDDVIDIHDCHAWTLDGEYNILTVHIVVKEGFDLNKQADLKAQIKDALSDLSIQHMTIEIESQSEDCELEDC